MLDYRRQIFEAAGDLTEDWKGKEESYKYHHWGGPESERWALAMSKLKAQGKLRWAQNLRGKTLKELHKKLFDTKVS